jgi:hypothetical protein
LTASVVFYISGHGFGHASREVEIINAFGALTRARILVRSAVNDGLLARTLRVPYVLHPGPCDTGIVQSTSIAHDDEGTVETALAFYAGIDARIDAEVRALGPAGVNLIVGDVPPLAFEVAARLGVPGVAIGNFTWDWIYETHPGFLPRGARVLDRIRDGYRQATRALQLPFSDGFDIFREVAPLPLVARRPTRPPAETRAHFGLPPDGPVALLSFGGYGLPSLDLAALDCLPDWTIVTTDRVTSDAPPRLRAVRRLDERAFMESPIRYEDLIAAVDVVITKPGYGIIAECIAARTAMLYTSRGTFREYDLLVRALPRFVRSRFIRPADLLGGRWRAALDALVAQPAAPETMATDGADVAARLLAGILARDAA